MSHDYDRSRQAVKRGPGTSSPALTAKMEAELESVFADLGKSWKTLSSCEGVLEAIHNEMGSAEPNELKGLKDITKELGDTAKALRAVRTKLLAWHRP